MPQLEKVNLAQKFSLFSAHYQPKIVGELNGQLVKLVKFKGDFTWHHHEHEDEMFLVVKGSFVMKLRDGDVTIREGEFFIVPKGVEHCPTAADEVQVMLFEPATTLNTGNVTNERTQPELQRI
jgi:mannose-6-phosphate isomerase-like protein (cupin superfamily)